MGKGPNVVRKAGLFGWREDQPNEEAQRKPHVSVAGRSGLIHLRSGEEKGPGHTILEGRKASSPVSQRRNMSAPASLGGCP